MSTRAFSVRNNSSRDTLPATVVPWLNTEPIPSFKNKDAYREWCKHPDTDYIFFSMVEATTSTLRTGHGNEPFLVHGVVADYDAPDISDAELAAGLKRVPSTLPVFAWNRTFSKGVRMVWRFERPVFFVNQDTFKRLMNRCVKELKLKSLFPNLDDHIYMPELYYCAGSDWTVNESAVIPDTLVSLWFGDAVRADKSSPKGTEIPLELVAAEVQKRWPGRWQGDFAENARGVRFWVDGADAQGAAIVKKTGMIAFTGNKLFTSWAEIFGKEWVDQFVEKKLGAPKSELYSDGKKYFQQNHLGHWVDYDLTRTLRLLDVEYGLNDRNELSAVLHHVDKFNRVSGCLPFPLNEDKVVAWNGGKYLNSATARAMKPVDEPQEWGMNFPWVAHFFSVLFLDERNLMFFLAWLSHWLKGVHAGKQTKGHALFIVGPPGTGKSLLLQQVIAPLVGGAEDAAKNFVDGKHFNSSLFDKALWYIDDSSPGQNREKHDRFSVMVKACVANSSFPYEAKYGIAASVPFFGRLIVCMNDDPFSLGMLPDIDQSLLDKTALLRTDNVEPDVTGDREANQEMIARELPYFLRWLLDWEPDESLLSTRFGVKEFHDRDILSAARANTPSASIVEWVRIFLQEYRRGMNEGDKRTHLELSAEQILCEMAKIDACRHFANQYMSKSSYFGRLLSNAAASPANSRWLVKLNRESEKRGYRISLVHFRSGQNSEERGAISDEAGE